MVNTIRGENDYPIQLKTLKITVKYYKNGINESCYNSIQSNTQNYIQFNPIRDLKSYI